jgi:hypothetical protein
VSREIWAVKFKSGGIKHSQKRNMFCRRQNVFDIKTINVLLQPSICLFTGVDFRYCGVNNSLNLQPEIRSLNAQTLNLQNY